MLALLEPSCLWITCTILIYYSFEFIFDYTILYRLLFTSILSNPIFFIIIYLYRVDKPIIYTQFHAYPHKYIAPLLSSSSSFHPTPWLWNRYLETYIPSFFKVSLPFETTQEIIHVESTNKDKYYDGECSITWSPLTNKHINHPQMSPIIIIVPGLTGDINARYCRVMMIDVHKNGWQSVIFNPRGRAGIKFKSPQSYSVGYTEDLRQTIQYIHDKYPNRMLFAVGYSLGANYLAKYMGEESTNSLLNGAVCCACPTDPIVCNVALQRQPMMDKLLAKLLKNVLLQDEVLEKFKTRPTIECQKGLSCTTLRQFDHYIIAPQFGFRSCMEYYRKSGAGYTLMDIAKPTLFLYAKNDITVPIDVFCPEDYDGNPYMCAIVTRFGSHSMSWLQGVWKFNSWQTQITIEYLRAVFMFKCKEELDKTFLFDLYEL